MGSAAQAQALLWATQAGGTDNDQGTASRPPRAATATSSGCSSWHGDLRGGRAHRDHPSPPRAKSRYLRCQVRPRRRAAVGHPGRRHRPRRRHRHRDHGARRQLRHRVLRWHGDLRRGRAQRDHPNGRRRAGISSLPSTPRRSAAVGHPGRRHLRARHGIATTARGDSYVTGVPRHGDLRRGRAQRDQPHRRGPSTHLRCQVRPRRRSCSGRPGPAAPPTSEGFGIATTERGDSYVTGVSRHGDLRRRASPTRPASPPGRDSIFRGATRLRCQVRPRRRAALGHPSRRHQLPPRPRHRDHRARRQLRHRGFSKARRPSARASPTRPRLAAAGDR